MSMVTTWPFSKRGIDIIGPLPVGWALTKFAVVVVDYFIRWVEAIPLAKILAANKTRLVWKNIISRFGIPLTLMIENGKQFDNPKFWSLCANLGIKNAFSSLVHPQANGQVETRNKNIKYNIKIKLEWVWPYELPKVLWPYITTPGSSTSETPFSLTYGSKAVIPIEIGILSHHTTTFNWSINKECMHTNCNMI